MKMVDTGIHKRERERHTHTQNVKENQATLGVLVMHLLINASLGDPSCLLIHRVCISQSIVIVYSIDLEKN